MESINYNNTTYYNITTALDVEYDSSKFIKTNTGFQVLDNIHILLIFSKLTFQKPLQIIIMIKRDGNNIAFDKIYNYTALHENDVVNFYVDEKDLDCRIYETSFRIYVLKHII